MKHIEGESRDQIVLFNETLEDLLNEEEPVRFIDIFVDKLNLKELGFKVKEATTGRSSYKSEILLKIYVYGYLNKIRSSRKLEKECRRNTELIWLTGRLAPDFKTIADFRKDNKKGIQKIFKEFLKICHRAGLISFGLVGIDGTKISAQNHNNNVYQRKNIEEIIHRIDQKIEEYLNEMDKNDKEEKNDFEFLSEKISERLKRLKTKKEKAEAIKKIFELNPEMEKYYANDPESRFMNDKGKSDIAYNLQTAVDDANKLIVAIEVTNENNDIKQMSGMCDRVEEIKDELNVKTETIKVSDAGYYSEPQILECLDRGHNVYMPNPEDEHKARIRGKKFKEEVPAEEYQVDKFKYDPGQDVYYCPEGNPLVRNGKKVEKVSGGKEIIRYRCGLCDQCEVRNKCTGSSEGRTIKVPVRKEEIENFKKKIRSEAGKRIIKTRKEICEHPFGSIKRNMGYSYYLMKGREGVLAESCLAGFVHNLIKVINIVGIKELMNLI